jgi:hypothetical protein
MRNNRTSQVPEDVARLRDKAASRRRTESGLSATEAETLNYIADTDWRKVGPAEVAWLRARTRDVLA